MINNEYWTTKKKPHLGEPIEIPQGIHTYGFSCDLPFNLPSSMEGTYGSIRYKVIITFEIPNYPDKIFEAGFTVLKTCNLNDFPELKVHYLLLLNNFRLTLFFVSLTKYQKKKFILLYSHLLTWNVRMDSITWVAYGVFNQNH